MPNNNEEIIILLVIPNLKYFKHITLNIIYLKIISSETPANKASYPALCSQRGKLGVSFFNASSK